MVPKSGTKSGHPIQPANPIPVEFLRVFSATPSDQEVNAFSAELCKALSKVASPPTCFAGIPNRNFPDSVRE